MGSGNILPGIRSQTEGREGWYQKDDHVPGPEMNHINSPDINFYGDYFAAILVEDIVLNKERFKQIEQNTIIFSFLIILH